MKKLKDLIYDYNDIVLAILIIVIAGAVIFWKVSDIMAYPSFARNQAKDSQQTELPITEEDTTPIDVDPIVAPGEDLEGQAENEDPQAQGGEGQTQSNENQGSSTGVTKDTVFTVPSGYASSKIADKLAKEGLCTKEAFDAAVKSLNAESKLRAGDFTIPAGSTAEDIVKIIANIK